MEATITQLKTDAIVNCISASLDTGFYYEAGNGGRAEALAAASKTIRTSEQFDTQQIVAGINAAQEAGLITAQEAAGL